MTMMELGDLEGKDLSSVKDISLTGGPSQHNNRSRMSSVSEDFSDDDDFTSAVVSVAGDGANDKKSSKDAIGQHETVAVNRSKALVYLVILLAAAAMGTATYFFMTRESESDFEAEFLANGVEVFDEVENLAVGIFGQLFSLGTSITSYSVNSNVTWPFVTDRHWLIRAKEAQELTLADMFLFAPVVLESDKVEWEAYARENQGWFNVSAEREKVIERINNPLVGDDDDRRRLDSDSDEDSSEEEEEEEIPEVKEFDPISSEIYSFDDIDHDHHKNHNVSAYVPIWEYGPKPLDSTLAMLDLHSHPVLKGLTEDSIDMGRVLLSPAMELDFLLKHVAKQPKRDDDDDDRRRNRRRRAQEEEASNDADASKDDHERPDHDEEDPDTVAAAHSEGEGEHEEDEDEHHDEDGDHGLEGLHSFFVQPVYQNFDEDSPVGGFVLAVVSWESFFADVLFDHVVGVTAVIQDDCGGPSFTYRIDGEEAEFAGYGDLHDPNYDHLKIEGPIAEFANLDLPHRNVTCGFRLLAYPSDTLRATFQSKKPARYTTAVVLIFAFTALVFLGYDLLVQRRQKKVLTTATRTTEIVHSLFPKDVAKRLQEEAAEQEASVSQKNAFTNKAELRNFMNTSGVDDLSISGSSHHRAVVPRGKPIADLFPSATVMFADLVGFTAWSSAREPSQVFLLLESIYATFDGLAKKRRVFKVETVGDCYVACCGLPDPRKDHAVVMARFSSDCLHAMYGLTRRLELELGPDTAELAMRFGLHSGPVTAGVLRGERARFQLFGDTVNVTARMESTGTRDRIHVSQEYAEELYAAGKGHWLTLRDEKVVAKGKGEMQTYWLELRQDAATSALSTATSVTGPIENTSKNEDLLSMLGLKVPPFALAEKRMRLVEWNTEQLTKKLKDVVARRQATDVQVDTPMEMQKLEEDSLKKKAGDTLGEVAEVINLPHFSADKKRGVDSSNVELSLKVHEQLRGYMHTIAQMYRDNPFHNFEHASHVAMSTHKLMARIIAPDIPDVDESSDEDDLKSRLHDHTYGISNDPITQLAMHLAAVLHDADHLGVPNSQLIKENAHIAAVYHNKSIAEQNSVDLAWHVLMEDTYKDLRRAIYVNGEEFLRFRRVLVNAVMATDILDKELGAARKERWNKAFAESAPVLPHRDVINRKATIVLEHLIQASDVAHTMQHWHIYRKWNARFFLECFKNYKEGRAEKNPADTWYEGEIGFFDYYIIPLAKKLKDCGVFGVSSDEYLNYAKENRTEWATRGKQLVAELVEIAELPETMSRFDSETKAEIGAPPARDDNAAAKGDESTNSTAESILFHSSNSGRDALKRALALDDDDCCSDSSMCA